MARYKRSSRASSRGSTMFSYAGGYRRISGGYRTGARQIGITKSGRPILGVKKK